LDNRQKNVLSIVRSERESLIELIRKLIGFNTTAPTPGEKPMGEDRSCQEYVADVLRNLDMEVDMWEPEVEKMRKYPFYINGQQFENRPVLAARLKGSESGRSLILNGHIDVVSAEPKNLWRHGPWSGDVENGRIYGRGSCDMKGGIAAMIKALEAIIKAGLKLRGDVIVETVIDEEINGIGTAACIERGYRADAALIPEPTGLNVWIANRGLLWAELEIMGRSGHAELRHPHWKDGGAVNSIEKAMFVLEGLKRLEMEWEERADKQHRLLSPPRMVPTILRGGDFWATIPEKSKITMDIQYLPSERDEKGYGHSVKREIENHLQQIAKSDSWLAEHPPSLRWLMDLPPLDLNVDQPVVAAMSKSTKLADLEAKIAGLDSWTDAAHLMNLVKTPGICFGPGPTFTAHTIDEYVSIMDLLKTTEVLSLFITDWCGCD